MSIRNHASTSSSGDEGGRLSVLIKAVTHPPVGPLRYGQRYTASPSHHLLQDRSAWEKSGEERARGLRRALMQHKESLVLRSQWRSTCS